MLADGHKILMDLKLRSPSVITLRDTWESKAH